VNDVASCDPKQDAMTYLHNLPPGTIDAYFGGHTHSQMRQYVNGIPAVQGGAYSREFATVDLWVDPSADKVTKTDIRPHTMICTFVYEGTEQCDPRYAPPNAKLVPRLYDGTPIANDPRVASVIEPFLKKVAAKREEDVRIRVADRITTSSAAESPLGDLIADALRDFAQADFGMMNSGGIRAELQAKNLIYADVFAVSPFDNFPAIVKLTAAEIIEVLRLTSVGNSGIMQVSGLHYTVDASKDNDKPPMERNRIVSVTLADGTPLDPQKLYTVAMPDFIAAGGDWTLDVMSKVPPDRINISYARPIRDILAEVWAKRPQPLVPKVEGRITVLNPQSRAGAGDH